MAPNSNEASGKSSSQPNETLAQTIDRVLLDGRVDKAELAELAKKYEAEKGAITSEVQARCKNLMKDSIAGMLKEYTLENDDDKNKLRALLVSVDLTYTLDASIDFTNGPVKVKLDGNSIRPLKIYEGFLTEGNEHTFDMKSLLSFRQMSTIEARDFIEAVLKVSGNKNELSEHMNAIDGKITQESKSNLLSYVTELEGDEKRTISPKKLSGLKTGIERLSLLNDKTPVASVLTSAKIAKEKTPNVDEYKNKDAVLKCVQKIPGLGNVNNLSSIGFTLNDKGSIVEPRGLKFTSESSEDCTIALVEGYRVENEKIIEDKKKLPESVDGKNLVVKEGLIYLDNNLFTGDILENKSIAGKSFKYFGSVKDGKYDGKGTHTFRDNSIDGDVYVGNWRAGKRDGQGIYTFKEGGKIYKGEFKDGERGTGEMRDRDGNVIAIYKDGKETLSPGQNKILTDAFGKSGSTTATVYKNATVIVDLLSNAPNIVKIKPAIELLSKGDVGGFQGEVGADKDSIIGCTTIIKLLEKAGIAKDQIPEAITKKAGKEKKGDGEEAGGVVERVEKDEKLLEVKGSDLKANVADVISYKGKPFTGKIASSDPMKLSLSRYSGDVKNGKFEGTGKYSSRDGSFSYEGGFRNGEFEGQGKATYSNGYTFNGEWRKDSKWNGKVSDKSGSVIYTYENGVEKKIDNTPKLSPLESSKKEVGIILKSFGVNSVKWENTYTDSRVGTNYFTINNREFHFVAHTTDGALSVFERTGIFFKDSMGLQKDGKWVENSADWMNPSEFKTAFEKAVKPASAPAQKPTPAATPPVAPAVKPTPAATPPVTPAVKPTPAAAPPVANPPAPAPAATKKRGSEESQ